MEVVVLFLKSQTVCVCVVEFLCNIVEKVWCEM